MVSLHLVYTGKNGVKKAEHCMKHHVPDVRGPQSPLCTTPEVLPEELRAAVQESSALPSAEERKLLLSPITKSCTGTGMGTGTSLLRAGLTAGAASPTPHPHCLYFQ